MKKKLIIFCIISLMGCMGAIAQQIPLYSQYYINPFVYNPAYTGVSQYSSAYLIHRNQWQDFPGAPVTSAITYDAPLRKEKMGLGFIASSDVTGLVNRNELQASFSYKAKLSENNTLYFGLSAGVLDNRIDFSKLNVISPGEASIYNNPADRRTDPDAAFGMMYLFKKLEIGVSAQQLFNVNLPYINAIDSRTYYSLVRHYIGSARYTFNINKELKVYPVVLVRTAANVPWETDMSLVTDWSRLGWFGVSYRSNLSLGFNAGIHYKGITVGYVYDIPTSSISGFAGSSSEILLGYTFGKAKDDKFDDIMNKLDNIEKQTKKIDQRIDTLENKMERFNFITADGLKQDVKVGDIFVLKNVNFDYKSYSLTLRSFDILDELVTFMNNNPTVKIRVQGHTDDIGSDGYNDNLSTNRAKAVADYLEESGVDPKRLDYKGFGKREPMAKGKNERARTKNRRVEFMVTGK